MAMERKAGRPLDTQKKAVGIETPSISIGIQYAFKVPACGTCPMLVNGLCSVYESRPALCRLWGLTKSMRCPHCDPERFLTDIEAYAFLDEVRRIGF